MQSTSLVFSPDLSSVLVTTKKKLIAQEANKMNVVLPLLSDIVEIIVLKRKSKLCRVAEISPTCCFARKKLSSVQNNFMVYRASSRNGNFVHGIDFRFNRSEWKK